MFMSMYFHIVVYVSRRLVAYRFICWMMENELATEIGITAVRQNYHNAYCTDGIWVSVDIFAR